MKTLGFPCFQTNSTEIHGRIPGFFRDFGVHFSGVRSRLCMGWQPQWANWPGRWEEGRSCKWKHNCTKGVIRYFADVGHVQDHYTTILNIFFSFSGSLGLLGPKFSDKLNIPQESPQPEIIRNLPQPPILMGAGPAHMVVYARNKAGQVRMAWLSQIPVGSNGCVWKQGIPRKKTTFEWRKLRS